MITEIADDGFITILTDDRRECIAPGDMERAQELLGSEAAYWINQWTTEQIQAYWELIGTTPPELSATRAWAKDLIDHQAELCRLKFLTDGSGQALEYSYCGEEVRLALQQDNPQPADFPLLAAELDSLMQNGIMVTFQEVILKTKAEVDAWIEVGSQIKLVRRTAKLRVDAATTVAEIEAIFPITWPEPPEDIPIGTEG